MLKKISEKQKKILNIVFTSLEAIVVVLLMVFSIMTIQSSSNPDKTVSLFGSTSFTVLTDSMKPTFEAGDLIVAKKVSKEEAENLQKGDIICFWTQIDVDGDGHTEAVVNTHKIDMVLPIGTTYNGISYRQVAYVTKGDNNTAVDPSPVLADSVIAKYSYHIPNIGGWIYGAKQGNRYFFIIVLPLILLFIWNGYYVIRLLIQNQKEKALANSAKLTEEDRKQLLEEAKRLALEELKKELHQETKEQEMKDSSVDSGNSEEKNSEN